MTHTLQRAHFTHQQPKGFTLIELMVVLVILGVMISLTAVSMGVVSSRQQKQRVTTMEQQLQLLINHALGQNKPFALVLTSTDIPQATRTENAPQVVVAYLHPDNKRIESILSAASGSGTTASTNTSAGSTASGAASSAATPSTSTPTSPLFKWVLQPQAVVAIPSGYNLEFVPQQSPYTMVWASSVGTSSTSTNMASSLQSKEKIIAIYSAVGQATPTQMRFVDSKQNNRGFSFMIPLSGELQRND